MNKIAIVVTSFTGGANPELKEKMTKTLSVIPSSDQKAMSSDLMDEIRALINSPKLLARIKRSLKTGSS